MCICDIWIYNAVSHNRPLTPVEVLSYTKICWTLFGSLLHSFQPFDTSMDDNDASNKYNKTTFWMTGSLLLLPKFRHKYNKTSCCHKRQTLSAVKPQPNKYVQHCEICTLTSNMVSLQLFPFAIQLSFAENSSLGI
jgi:hypothetical protein